MSDITNIRRRADGSIDSDFYVAEGRKCRSVAAHELAGKTKGPSRRVLLSLTAFLALLPLYSRA